MPILVKCAHYTDMNRGQWASARLGDKVKFDRALD